MQCDSGRHGARHAGDQHCESDQNRHSAELYEDQTDRHDQGYYEHNGITESTRTLPVAHRSLFH